MNRFGCETFSVRGSGENNALLLLGVAIQHRRLFNLPFGFNAILDARNTSRIRRQIGRRQGYRQFCEIATRRVEKKFRREYEIASLVVSLSPIYQSISNFKEVEEVSLCEKPNIYCHFGQGFGELKYMPVQKWSTISQLLQEALASYNDLVAGMNLVLFEDAMMHICR